MRDLDAIKAVNKARTSPAALRQLAKEEHENFVRFLLREKVIHASEKQ
jgi:hypothetical protein